MSTNGYGSSPSSHVIAAVTSSPGHRSYGNANTASHAPPSYPNYHVSQGVNSSNAPPTSSTRLSYDVGTMLLNSHPPHYHHTSPLMSHQSAPSTSAYRYAAAPHQNHYSDYNSYEYHIQVTAINDIIQICFIYKICFILHLYRQYIIHINYFFQTNNFNNLSSRVSQK